MAQHVNDKPMLARASTGASGGHPIDVRTLVAGGGWVLDTKLDGIRAFWRSGRLINRTGNDITASFPEVVEALADVEVWLDGEIVALDGRFETVGTRDKTTNVAKVRQRAVTMPCRFVAFDMPGLADEPWSRRREHLVATAAARGFSVTPVSYDVAFIDQVKALGLEGVIAKQVTSRYQFGKRSSQWVKHKLTQRVSCLIYGYEPGKGSRELGAMMLAVLDTDGKPVPVGKVGTGFTDRQAKSLLIAIQNRELLIAEVEALSLTSGHTLRFPVFRGLRTDIAPSDCTIDQLDVLPRS